MHRRTTLTFVALLTLSVAVHANPGFTLTADKIDQIEMDGYIEDSWLTSTPASHFVQRSPREGEPSRMETFVYVRYTPDALLIAFDCHDTAPDSISGRLQRRDQGDNSDYVLLYLDTFHDKLNGYYFGLTAGGVQVDGTISNDYDYDETWDGIWESAVVENDHGWSAEMRIPFTTFRHSGYRADGWGINVERGINRFSEESYWVPQSRTHGNRASQWGTLQGLAGIESGTHLELLPHVVGRWDGATDQSGFSSINEWENIGIDLKVVPSPSWTMDLTFQPDFAQVDVDDEVINLSDYPVSVTEKRPFFLEGVDIFDIQGFTLLYTRNITDPDFGAKLTGNWGRTRSSVLAVQDVSESGQKRFTGAARSIFEMGELNTSGLTFTSQYDDSDFHVNVASFDSHIRWNKNEFKFNAAGVDRSGDREQPLGLTTEFYYVLTEALRFSVGNDYLGKDFNITDLGFSGYSNKRDEWLWAQYRRYPKSGILDYWIVNINAYIESMPDGTLFERGGNWNGNLRTKENFFLGAGQHWGAGWYRERAVYDSTLTWDRTFEDNYGEFFPVFHSGFSRWIWIETDDRKPLDLYAEINHGTYREGKMWDIEYDIDWRPLGNLEFTLGGEWIQIEGAQRINDKARSEYTVTRLRCKWSPTLDLSLRGSIQKVQEEDDLLTNLLLAWHWAPGSWAYLVYDENRPTDYAFTYNRANRTIRLKMTWFNSVH